MSEGGAGFWSNARCLEIAIERVGVLLFLALHLSRRHRFAAFADLSSDKERLRAA
jgi:hypothetical protein